ncbi:laminin EGF-like protein, partial [Teladorsagia circumcincta]
ISLDVAIPPSPGLSGSTAIGVEQCSNCPQGFTGSSCQNPATGYCRKKQRDYLNSPDDMSLIGWTVNTTQSENTATCAKVATSVMRGRAVQKLARNAPVLSWRTPLDGSLNGACNPLTGQCECRDGVTGRDCSRCQHRHAFIGGVCTSCDQGCYLPLMTMVDELEITLANQNLSTLRPIPWKRLSRIGNNTGLISEFMRGLDEGGESEVGGIARDSKYAKEAFAVVEGARFQAERMAKSVVSLEQFTTLAENLILDAQLTYANAFNTTQFLKHFHEHGGTTVGGATLDAWVREAEAHYNATLDRGEYIEKRLNRAEQEHKKNEELLKRVFANKLNDTSFENIQDRLDEFDQWLEDYRATIYDSSRKDTAEAEQMSNVVAKRIDRYKEVSNEIEKLRAEAEDDLAAARNFVDNAKGKVSCPISGLGHLI